MGNNKGEYDVFLSYHWRDHDVVELIARDLAARGLRVFFDRWYLTPGILWPQTLEDVLRRCHAVALFVGPEGMGPWQLREQFLALDRQSREETFPVIPVLLPGADPPLGFLKLNTWVALRTGADHSRVIETIARVVRGLPPGPDIVAPSVAGICPYRGLQVFREEDEPFFFGRECFTDRLVEEVQRKPFIAVVGASGSGKSSVVRAGLVPRLRAGADGHVWDVLTLTPGSRPLQALAAAIIPLLEPELSEVKRLAELGQLARHFAAHTIALLDVLLRALEKQRGTDRLLLFIDQWEELYSLCKDENARRCFITELLESSAHTSIKVVMTLRGDFYGQALGHRALVDRLQDTVVNLGPMTREELRRTIENPAQAEVVGLEFEPGLVDRILDDVGEQPGNLPLLEFVLAALWDKRRGRTLHFAAYEGMQGLKGAIADRADKIFQTELAAEQQEAARRVLLQLVRPGEGTPDTRKRALLPADDDPTMAVVRKLADARLLVTGRDETRLNARTVEIAHEALIQNWGLLQQWVNEDREFLRTRERIEAAAALWEQEGQIADRLLAPGRPLAEAEDLLTKRRSDLSAPLVRFIDASMAAETRRRDAARAAHVRELRRTRLTAAVALGVALVMTVLGIIANRATNLAEHERDKALSRSLAAQASLLVERGQGEDAMLKAATLAVESWHRMPNPDAYSVATNLLQWFPVSRIEPDPGANSPRFANFAFSPDGRFLVVKSMYFIRLIETANNKEIWRIEERDMGYASFEFSADSRLVLINSENINSENHARLLSTESGKEVFSVRTGEFTSHVALFQKGGSIGLVSMSEDGRYLALTAEDSTTRTDLITVIDTHTGRKACQIAHPMNRPQGYLVVFFSPNGELLVIEDWPSFHLFEMPSGRERTRLTVSDAFQEYFIGNGRWLVIEAETKDDHERTVHLIDPVSGRELSSIPLGKGGRVEFSDDGRFMVTREDNHNKVRLLVVPTGEERAHWQENSLRAFFDRSNQGLVLVTKSGLIRLIDPVSGQEKSRVKLTCEIDAVALRSETDSLVVSCENGEVYTFKTSTGKETAHFKVDGRVKSLSPDGRLIATQDKGEGVLRFNETSTGREFERVSTSGPIQISFDYSFSGPNAIFSSDGRYMAIPSPRGSIQLVDLSQAYSPFRLEAASEGKIALSHDRRLLAFAGPDHVIRVIDVTTGRQLGTLQHDEPVYSRAFSADGRFLITEQKSFLTLIEIETGHEVARLQHDHDEHYGYSIETSPDGNFLVIYNGPASLIVSSSLKEIIRFPSNQLCGESVFSPDGRVFAMANSDKGIVQLFDTANGAERLRIDRKSCGAQFSPDGQTLAVDDLEAEFVRFFDASTGTERLRMPKYYRNYGGEPRFSPDGHSMARVSNSPDGTALW